MKVTIENEHLTVVSKAAGAELTGIKLNADSTEYLWQGDPAHWARQSPVLFPIVGSVAGSRYTHGGRQYEMKNHGFARDMEFDIIHESESAVTYALCASADTLAAYPFRFRLEIGYHLAGSAVAVRYRVANQGDQEMLFSIGAHPAFNCPITPGNSFTDYYLEFDKNETLDRQFVNAANLLMAGKREPFLHNEKTVPLSPAMFDEGAYILEGVKSSSVALKGRDTEKAVTVSFPGFSQLGIWAPPGAPFVCIEPWYGIAEATDFAGDLAQKKGIQRLAPGGIFESEYRIIIT